MSWESFGVVGFDHGLLLQGQTGIAKPKSAYNSLIIGPRGLQYETSLQEIMCWESFDVVRFDLELLHQGQTRIAKLKSASSLCIIVSSGRIQDATARREILGVNALRGKLHQLGSSNLQISSLGGKFLWD